MECTTEQEQIQCEEIQKVSIEGHNEVRRRQA